MIQIQQAQMRSKILGLLYDKQQEQFLNLVLLKDKLPLAVNALNWIMINLCSIFLELGKRQNIIFPRIALETIYISLNPKNSLPYIQSYEDIQIPKEKRNQYAKNQMISILKQLNYETQLYNDQNITLQEIQQKLLQKIGYSESISTEFTQEFQNYLFIESNEKIHHQRGFTRVDSIKIPSFILNVQENEIVMKIYKQVQMYELREVEIIENFDSPYQPYLYFYIRYSNILILFLKKHKISFCKLISDCLIPRRNQEYTDELKLKGYLKIFNSMILSLENLSSMKIIHRDLKPDNIMFDFQNQIKNLQNLLQNDITCVIIDYDRSKQKVYENDYQTFYECNSIFKPPNTVTEYLPSYDIWQMGFIWMISLTQEFMRQPQQFIQNPQFRQLVSKKNQDYHKFIQEVKYSNIKFQDVYDKLIFKMLSFEPGERPTANQIKEKIENLIQSLN
ncbi:unnamed protein product [Paramecium sonneborni]|uniref:Protein kinase domain-containing protein n=1 Tax=Paramecium sonneborni TaxID=65129 RepID=A0A8S1QJN9_9CILI|nr:unnamed protein product [Paramecium sonneborni]